MSASGHHGKPEEEMFLNQPKMSPIVAPLRINKGGSASTGSAQGAPPTSPPPSQTVYPMPALPYPDGPAVNNRTTNGGSPAPYPYPDVRRIGSPNSGNNVPAGMNDTANRQRTGSVSSGQRTDSRTSATLAERRGNVPNPLPASPDPNEGLFQRPPARDRTPSNAGQQGNPYPEYHQQFWPAPDAKPSGPAWQNQLNVKDGPGINRFSSTASTNTTRAQRGSPPPPETPIIPPGAGQQRPQTDIEARFAASGIAGTETMSALQAQSLQSAAAQQRAANYGGMAPRQQEPPPRRPWTPTEQPGSAHPAPTVYQGPGEANQSPPVPTASPAQQPPQTPSSRIPPNALENDMGKLNVSDEPPPAYSRTPGVSGGAGYPNEKNRRRSGGAAVAAQPAQPAQRVSQQDHPAFANDPRSPGYLQQQQQQPQQQQQGQPQPDLGRQPSMNGSQQGTMPQRQPSQGRLPPASPPPLPEGWLAHLDPNSGQYYYIHLPTQSTQWEFPKGPTPLNLNDTPVSPSAHAYQNPLASPLSFSKPMQSPGMPMSPYEQHHLGGGLATPTAFTGPPPSSGVDLYKVVATNGVYFGPYLRYTNMNLETDMWLGSILLVTDAPQPPTIHLHQSNDLSPNPRQLKAQPIHQHRRWTFYKYAIEIKMDEGIGAKWTYAITSHLGCTRYEFLVAGRHETSWRFVATSGNDFSLNISANERARLGGVGFLWKDIMQKHAECGGFHCQLGLGSQIYADRIWKEIPSLKQWLATSGKEIRKNAAWTAAHEEDVSHAYFHYYTSHFDQPHLREAFAQIPHILTIDDHDIFDGFGSYPEYMQFSNMFKNIGRIGIEMYLLFQHHTTLELLRNVSNDTDLFTITGTGWHFVKFLGPAVVVVGPDTRSERNPHQVMAGPTYQGLFPKIAMLPQSVQHCILMVPVPVIYPRLASAEQIASTIATGKKAVTGTYNILGKVTSSVAGVVGAKGAVGSGFDSVKRAVGKSGLMGGILSPFGDIDVLDELKDQWTHESKDLERTYLIRTLQGIAHNRSIRFTFLSGAVNTCGAGLVHDPSHPSDHKTMYQLISSSVVNTPPPSYVLKLLNNQKPLYVPANGQRSTPSVPTDTKEDMMEIFVQDVTGQGMTNRKLMPRRNYVAIVAFDPEVVQGTFGRTDMAAGGGKLSLAADFMVQGEGAYGNVIKFGPVVVPGLEYGR